MQLEITEEQKTAIKAVLDKKETLTKADAETLYNYVLNTAAPVMGDDQIAEPFRYIIASMGGLRIKDLQALIGEDFDEALFNEFDQTLGFPFFVRRTLPNKEELIDLQSAQMHLLCQELMGEGNYKSCASDIGYYLFEKCEDGDIVRRVQCMHLLLDGGEAAAAAEYVSACEGEALRIAVMTMGNGLKDAPDAVKETIMDMTLADGEKVNLTKLLLLQLNDCIAIIGNPTLQRPVIDKLYNRIQQLIPSHPEITVLGGVAMLRTAQNERVLAQIARQQKKDEEAQEHEQGAQQQFMAALNYLMPTLQRADPLMVPQQQIDQFWLCLKICQEMGQPKAISLFFENIVKLERAQMTARTAELQSINNEEPEIDPETEKFLTETSQRIISQYIDMSKLYYQFPEVLREQFTNYSEETITLIKAYLDGLKTAEGEETVPTAEEAAADPEQLRNQSRICSYWQTLGELNQNLGKDQESYDALTEAQIQMMRHVAALQVRDGKDRMSGDQLMARLALSVTNHYLAGHFRKQNKGAHDLDVVLRANLDMAQDCFKYFPQDGRVIHFLINAALELGDNQHKTNSLMQELQSYKKAIQNFPMLNNLRLDQQLAIDVASILTKCGQLEAQIPQPRFKDAVQHLQNAMGIWSSLAQNTKNPEFQKNADFCKQTIDKISGK